MTELPIRMFFVGQFDEHGELFDSCWIRDGDKVGIAVFTEQLLAERWRDEFHPTREVREAGSVEQAERWTKYLRDRAPKIKYYARDATTIGTEGNKKAMFIRLPDDDER